LNVSENDVAALENAIHFFAQMSGEELQVWSEAAHAYAEKRVDVEEIKGEYRGMFLGQDT
jgi:hypothetical protein